jgi:hypothetical protein
MTQQQVQGALTEVASVRETADRLANGDTPDGADQIRVLAGLVRQLAEQVERLFDEVGRGEPSDEVGTQEPATNEPASGADAVDAQQHVADAADARTH